MHLIQKPITALPQLLIKMAILMTVLVLLLGLPQTALPESILTPSVVDLVDESVLSSVKGTVISL
jgi:hypothetical protein